jgi:hypothetical protein
MTDSILAQIQARNKLFLSGPHGSGKTTLALERVRWLLRQERVRGDDILVLVPQRTLGNPYTNALRSEQTPAGPPVQVTTVAGLARNAVELYWPLLASGAGFSDPQREPTFLDLETSQYHMARFVDEALDKDEFSGLVVERNRIISQVLDNLNKAAMQGIGIEEAYQRLELAVPGGDQRTAQLNALRTSRRISQQFRHLCMAETLVDYSLQIDLFMRHVLTNTWSRTHLFRSRRHLIADNVEEDTHAAHRLVIDWLPHLESALIVSDLNGGYRLFLGAEPAGVQQIAEVCDARIQLAGSYIMSPQLVQFTRRIDRAVLGRRAATENEGAVVQVQPTTEVPPETSAEIRPANTPTIPLAPSAFRFYPQMIRWVADEVQRLIQKEAMLPGQIAILAPFVSDALRFSLQSTLSELGIPSTTHRPSRALQAEPAARCLLTLAKLAHPQWGLRPASADVTLAMTLAITSLDPVRANLLTRIVFPEKSRAIELGRFAAFEPEMRTRITYRAGEQYDRLREWLYAYRSLTDVTPLDQFLARLFGELLSQSGFGFHDDYDAARVANQLVGSARNFRWALETRANRSSGAGDGFDLGRSYVHLIESGALGALYTPGWREPQDAVFIAPAYTFLMRNRAVDVQFWLDVGSTGWWERLYQPLTHPYVLSQSWSVGQPWSDLDEYQTRQQTMHRLLLGLVRRARRGIYLGITDYSESGYEQRGPLLNLINRVLVQERDGVTGDG